MKKKKVNAHNMNKQTCKMRQNERQEQEIA